MDFENSWIFKDKKKGFELFWSNLYNMISRLNWDLEDETKNKVNFIKLADIISYIETQKFKVESVEIAAQINEPISFVYPIQSKSTNNHYAYSEARSDAHLAEIFHPPTV